MSQLSMGAGTFWSGGALSPMELACLTSVVRNGVGLTMFSYDPITNLPDGVEAADAADLVPKELLSRVIFQGKPNLSHFSDVVRYRMMAERDLVWVDSDLLVLREPSGLDLPDIVVREEQGGLNGAVLYISRPDVLAWVEHEVQSLLDTNLRWGQTGPLLLNRMVREFPDISTYGHETFYPVEHYDIWKVVLPRHREECEAQTSEAVGIHLFNNILVRMGYWKSIAPPVGSYLHARLREMELLDFFDSTYPESVMEAVMGNFRRSQDGRSLGIKSVVRELAPSVARTYRHYRPRSNA